MHGQLPKSSLIGTNPRAFERPHQMGGRRLTAGGNSYRARPGDDGDEDVDAFVSVGAAAAAVTSRLLAARRREGGDHG